MRGEENKQEKRERRATTMRGEGKKRYRYERGRRERGEKK